jgi:hypothetical protein
MFGCTGILIENVNSFDNGNGGNASIGIGQNTTATLRGGGSNCNATGSAYSGGIDIYGNNCNITIDNYILAYNSKDAFNGAGLLVFGLTATTLVSVKNTVIYQNEGGAGGGAIFIDGANVTFRECKILNNSTTGSFGPNRTGNGVAIVGGTVKLAKCVISGNASTTTTDFGGVGINPSSSNIILSIDSCLFSGNTGTKASGKDLGARLGSGGTFTITVNESTFGSYGAGTSSIDIGGGSTNSCTGNSFVITNSGNPAIIYSGGGAPNCSLGAGSNTNVSVYTANPIVPSFSGNCGSFLLPVELLSFSSKCEGKSAELSWSTSSERNNDFFIVEKGDDKGAFETISQIKAFGNSSSTKEYDFRDLYASKGLSYYRLSQVDFDGRKEILSTISLNNTCIKDGKSTCFYDALTNELIIYAEFKQFSDYSIKLINTLGQTIQETTFENKQESSKFILKLEQNLTNSIYFVVLESHNKQESIKVIKY